MTIQIEKNVPLPARLAWNTQYPFASMEVGDSFHVPNGRLSAISTSAIQFGKRHNKKFTLRTVEKGIRVWRTE